MAQACPHCGAQHDARESRCPTTGLPIGGDPKLVGTTLANRYQLVRLLGDGGMGAVYKAADQVLRRFVAIKLLHPTVAQRPAAVERFQREARAAAAIGHPNIIDILDFGVDGRPYMVMEYLRGRSLSQVLHAEGALSIQRAVSVAAHSLAGLAAAHERGILHRDLKPANLMLVQRFGDKSFVKVCDFGFAALMGPTSAEDGKTLTPARTLVGTPAYASPERLRGDDRRDPRVDIYSIGVVLFEMIAGRRPFDGETFRELARAVKHDPPPRLSSLRADVPRALDEVILRALAKEPEGRFRNAGEFAAALVPFGGRSIALDDEPSDSFTFEVWQIRQRDSRKKGTRPSIELPAHMFPPETRPPPARAPARPAPPLAQGIAPIAPPRLEHARAEQARAEQARAEQARAAEHARMEQARLDQVRAEQARAAEHARMEQARAAEHARMEQARAEQARLEQVRAEQARAAEHARMEQARLDQVRAEQARAAELLRMEQARVAEQARAPGPRAAPRTGSIPPPRAGAPVGRPPVHPDMTMRMPSLGASIAQADAAARAQADAAARVQAGLVPAPRTEPPSFDDATAMDDPTVWLDRARVRRAPEEPARPPVAAPVAEPPGTALTERMHPRIGETHVHYVDELTQVSLLVRGRILLAALRFVARRFGERSVKDVLDALEPAVRRIFDEGVDPERWYPGEALTSLAERIDAVHGRDDLHVIVELGRSIAEGAFDEMRRLKPPSPPIELLLSELPRITRGLIQGAETALRRIGRGYARIELVERTSPSLTLAVLVLGFVERSLGRFGAADVEVNLLSARALDDAETLLDISWIA